MRAAIEIESLDKSFTLHLRGGYLGFDPDDNLVRSGWRDLSLRQA